MYKGNGSIFSFLYATFCRHIFQKLMRSKTQKKLNFSIPGCVLCYKLTNLIYCTHAISGVASAISEGNIFIYSCSAQLISFEIESSKEINCAEHEYMNMTPSLIALATLLHSIVVLASQLCISVTLIFNGVCLGYYLSRTCNDLTWACHILSFLDSFCHNGCFR